MRTSLNEIRDIEAYLMRDTTPEDGVVFEARLILDPELADRVKAQAQACELVRLHGRRQLRADLDALHAELFGSAQHRPFARRILRMFRSTGG